jgi:serine/threonine protein kinase
MVGAHVPEAAAGMPSGLGIGSRVAGYVLEEQIGAGGMAVVFRALDERLGRRVAVKVLAPGLAADTAFRRRFIRESRAAASVDDPHIIPVHEAGESGGVLFIAMRYVPGPMSGPCPPIRARCRPSGSRRSIRRWPPR